MSSTPTSTKSLSGVGLLAAVAASLCCITPLLALVGGLGGAASSFAWLEPYRPYLVGLTVLVLSFAWYRQLRPQSTDCCVAPEKPSIMRYTGSLGTVTVLAALLLTFPYYEAKLHSRAAPSVQIIATNAAVPVWQSRTYRIGGMTCEACARHVEHAVQQVAGVQAVTVSYSQATAQVRYNEAQAHPDEVEKAINGTGYHILPSTSPN